MAKWLQHGRPFADHDEIYWNVTGNYWNFPIARANATITLPQGAGKSASMILRWCR